MMHILWAKEHNYVCDMLMQNITNITWTDEKLFQTARLIIAAVIAKIHILEWTTAVLDNDIVKLGSIKWSVYNKTYKCSNIVIKT
jgi:uncharacterized glyoxalase superfamily metalloenzyme YdcJ